MMTKIRTYHELSRFDSFEDRYDYLKLKGKVGQKTFGFDRWINQRFYKSSEWIQAKNYVITRDLGCDLGIPGYEIYSGLMIHHMNPMSLDDVKHGHEWITDPNFLITTSLQTHNAIHYGDKNLLPRGPIVRERGDTTLWRR
jgi:hypothetical protein